MTQKIKIVGKHINGLTNSWFLPLTSQYFEFEIFDESKTYDPKSCLFYAGYFDDTNLRMRNTDDPFFKRCFGQEFKMLYDNTWELHLGDKGQNVHVIHNLNWFWYNESFWYKNLGYDRYVPVKTYKKLGLMPLRRGRPHRDKLLLSMSPWLDDFYWSYIDYDRYLPGDADPQGDATRHINPQWYNDTYFSVIAETTIEPGNWQNIFITEKTFKAIAFEHPFLVWGHPGTLRHLKQQGFETFENLFDESYDNELTDYLRLQTITKNVKNFQKKMYDDCTLRKVKHNRDLFYNGDLIFKRFKEEIIDPILEFAAR